MHIVYRQKEDEKAAVDNDSSKRKAPANKAGKKKKLKTDEDENLAQSLAGRRSSARDRDVNRAKSKKAAALAALKKQRQIQQDLAVDESSSDGSEMDYDDDDDSDEEYEDAGLKPWQKKEAAKSAGSRLDDGSDMEIDEDEDDGAGQNKQRRVRPSMVGSEADAGFDDFLKVTIPRRRLARWCNEPFFNAAVLECFVRLFIGEDEKENKMYRLCEIVDVKTDKKSYKFPTTNRDEKPVTTNQILRLKFGTSEKDFPMYLVSDAMPTEIDVQKYVTTQRNNRAEVLSKRRATKLRRLQDNLVNNYTYTTEDIEKNLRQRKKLGKNLANLGAEQTKVSIAVQAAQHTLSEAKKRLDDAKAALLESNDDARTVHDHEKSIDEYRSLVDQAQRDLDDRLDDEKALTDIVKNRNDKLTGRQKDQNWARVNKRAVQINQKADREGYKVQQEAEARKAAGEKEKFNPYARRRVKPKVLWEVGQAKDDEGNDEEKKESRDEATSTTEATVDVATPTLVHENEKSIALSEYHQFTIDEEGMVQSTGIGGFGLDGSKKGAWKRERKGISLDEYLERKANSTL